MHEAGSESYHERPEEEMMGAGIIDDGVGG